MLTLDKAPAFAPAVRAYPAVPPTVDPAETEFQPGLTELTAFSLRCRSGFEQIALAFENPLCRLLGQTLKGSQVCNRGCGLSPQGCVARQPDHVCPFGMSMYRIGVHERGSMTVSHWIGRRFVSVRAMHDALDGLLAEGLDEETIFRHLPPNPVILGHELRQAAGDATELLRVSERSEPAPMAPSAPAVAVQPRTGPIEARAARDLTHLLEFVLQLQTLLASADQPGAICERFLRSLGGLLPFDTMSIYLRNSPQAEPVLVTAVEREPAGPKARLPRAHNTRLPAHAVGAQALAEGRVLIQVGESIRHYAGSFRGPGRVALPFPLAQADAMGIWLAEVEEADDAATAEWQVDSPLLMQTLAEVLAARLAQVSHPTDRPHPAELPAPISPSAHGSAPESAPLCGSEELLRRVTMESVRCSRHGYGFGLLLLGLAVERDDRPLPCEELDRQIALNLRPYDSCMRLAHGMAQWAILLPHTSEHEARRIAFRLISVMEDVLDAHGGAEELGIRPVAGISLGGADAGSAGLLVGQAEAALSRVLASAHEPAIQVFGGGDREEVG